MAAMDLLEIGPSSLGLLAACLVFLPISGS
jgi:hypothetical protein